METEIAVFIPTRIVTKALIGTRTLNMRAGTTDVNALDRALPYATSRNLTWGFAGPMNDSTIVLVNIREKRGESFGQATRRAGERCQTICKRIDNA